MVNEPRVDAVLCLTSCSTADARTTFLIRHTTIPTFPHNACRLCDLCSRVRAWGCLQLQEMLRKYHAVGDRACSGRRFACAAVGGSDVLLSGEFGEGRRAGRGGSG